MTSIASNVTEVIDKFGGVQSPIDCWKLNIIATLVVVFLFLSVSANSTLLFTFWQNKELRTPLNLFIIAMTAVNLGGSLSEFTYIIVSNYSCRWMFGYVGCHTSGFVMYTVGMFQIYLTAAISFERYYIIYKPMSIRDVNFKTCSIGIAACAAFALFWSVVPLFGWSHYTLEANLTSCSVEWAERSLSVVSYNFCLFVFGYIFPMGLIIYCNVKLMQIVKAMPNMAKDDEKAKKRLENERQLTINMVIYVACFSIAWTPYAIVAMATIFSADLIPPMGALLPAIFAKSSMWWTTIFFIMSNKQIKYKIFKAPPAEGETAATTETA